MKNTVAILFLFLFFSCGKKTDHQEFSKEVESAVPPYDTIAIDSFSQGATSVDIAAKIKMSSIKYQDSLRQIKLKNEEERLLKKAEDEKLADEKKAEDLKKKAEAEKKKATEKIAEKPVEKVE